MTMRDTGVRVSAQPGSLHQRILETLTPSNWTPAGVSARNTQSPSSSLTTPRKRLMEDARVFVDSISQGPTGTLVSLTFPHFVPLSSQGRPPEWSLYFIYLPGWGKKTLSVWCPPPLPGQLAGWGPPVMHKSVFIILAWGTLFHQVHDSTEERRWPQPGYISPNQTFQGGGEKWAGGIKSQNHAARFYVKRRTDGQIQEGKTSLMTCVQEPRLENWQRKAASLLEYKLLCAVKKLLSGVNMGPNTRVRVKSFSPAS